MAAPGKYSNSSAWADIQPIEQDDGANALATISYSDGYCECMSYLRGCMAANDLSPRVLELTEDVINMNPAHYTVWLYRAKVLFANDCDLRNELLWLEPMSLKFQKNYQIWHHRQQVVERLGSCEGETAFIAKMFELDAKNYHVWSYRQWLVKRFGLWDKGELGDMDKLLDKDVRNNSAWNHRWYVVFGRADTEKVFADREVVQRELEYAQEKIRLAPQNQSPWNYIRGLSRKATGDASLPLRSLKEFASEFASVEEPDKIKSSHALDLLADAYAEEGKKVEASKSLDLLATKYDPIRANYWNWRKSKLNGETGTSVQASA